MLLRLVTLLPRRAKQAVIVAVDLTLLPLALLTALALQSNGMPALDTLLPRWPALPLLMAIAMLLAVVMGIHRIQLKAYDSRAVALTAMHAAVMGLTIAVLDGIAGYGTPAAAFISFAIVYFLMCVLARALLLQIVLAIYRSGRDQVRVLIYGAGRTGQQLAAALKTDDTILPVAFVDDMKSLQSMVIHGMSVYSPVAIPSLVQDKGVHRVLLAMPSIPRPRLAQITRRLEDMGLDVQALPSFAQLAGNDTPLIDQLRPVTPQQLLGRAQVDALEPERMRLFAGKSVLVSGAGGSIGSELCRQLLSWGPRKIVLYEISELALYNATQELDALGVRTGVEIVPVLGSVADSASVRRVLQRHNVEIVLHAAAYKHVPIVEANPVAGFANNVLGTHALATVAMECGVERFILISSDKAVRPTNMMGASKRLAEIVIQDLASRAPAGGTIFAMVRFGNVMGSSGSVIPLFQEQIAKGGPVTLTHREVTRYFMTIPEAARLVLLAGSFASGGDVFVLDMGDPIPIYDLACQLIEAAGYTVRGETNPDGDIEIVLTGLRPGEKLHEELLIGEGKITTPHPKILQAREDHLSEIEVAGALRALRAAVTEADEDAIRAIVARYVEGGQRLMPSAPAQAT